ncbi:hypothetical protein L1D13_21720 [Vibrio tubiashii]|uniref:hypothetical protein n=1 Tax=Vibrio tubiashii TaxID=29498 RepID=UPI001EFD6F2B|nr:hypothetical protein [Vibrio tubiashii]MCG9584139.1 hypothetical protein [Vibrio tubiashii]MCG9617734.1 hypothetical protein [Vibrio tubiashii]MCG9689532.1 hypothetical protein [Vibrio tubiashii]
MSGYIYLLLTVVFTVYGQIVIKWKMNSVSLPDFFGAKVKILFLLLLDPFIISGFLAAFLSALAWMAAMTKFEVSYAYPLIICGLVLLTTSFAVIFLGESLSTLKLAALFLMVLGIGLLVMDAK